MPTLLKDVRTQQRQAAEAVRAAAIRRARAERAGQAGAQHPAVEEGPLSATAPSRPMPVGNRAWHGTLRVAIS